MNPIDSFLAAKTYAVAGDSARQHKYGNKVFRGLVATGRETFPLNPVAEQIEGHTAYPRIADLPVVPNRCQSSHRRR
ncbi:putative CoA-binding protein [Rhodopirellula rubra]|uniref:Putative CoA-binding protein n=1 Tax=Aporhodopirellula rubra TaxID=980271 RepID=A0A7W5H521_9BACT|nr:putative CoA-binding protein [Aporhodopirellula rubra]